MFPIAHSQLNTSARYPTGLVQTTTSQNIESVVRGVIYVGNSAIDFTRSGSVGRRDGSARALFSRLPFSSTAVGPYPLAALTGFLGYFQ